MGEACKDALRLDFDRKLKLEFHGTKVTSDACLLAYRKLDEALGPTIMIDTDLRDNRMGKNTQHSIAALLKQAIYSRLAGCDETNDAERLCVDPTMRHIAGALRDKLIKIGAKVVRHSRYVIFQMAEVAVPGMFFRETLGRIGQLRISP